MYGLLLLGVQKQTSQPGRLLTETPKPHKRMSRSSP
jgi:hypothetical protein